jgi:hypothetical protein
MKKTGVCIAILLLGTTLAAAESTSTALKEFGIIGNWSQDCARSLTAGGDRVIIESPLFGSPIMAESNGLNNTTFTRSEIRTAERVTQDKLRMIVVPVSSGGVVLPPERTKPKELLFQKRGQYLSLFNGAMVLEQCLN